MLYIVNNFPPTRNKIHTIRSQKLLSAGLHNTYNHLRYIENSKYIQVHTVKNQSNKTFLNKYNHWNTLAETFILQVGCLFSVQVASSVHDWCVCCANICLTVLIQTLDKAYEKKLSNIHFWEVKVEMLRCFSGV